MTSAKNLIIFSYALFGCYGGYQGHKSYIYTLEKNPMLFRYEIFPVNSGVIYSNNYSIFKDSVYSLLGLSMYMCPLTWIYLHTKNKNISGI